MYESGTEKTLYSVKLIYTKICTYICEKKRDVDIHWMTV